LLWPKRFVLLDSEGLAKGNIFRPVMFRNAEEGYFIPRGHFPALGANEGSVHGHPALTTCQQLALSISQPAPPLTPNFAMRMAGAEEAYVSVAHRTLMMSETL
jgi:hypothetical protein